MGPTFRVVLCSKDCANGRGLDYRDWRFVLKQQQAAGIAALPCLLLLQFQVGKDELDEETVVQTVVQGLRCPCRSRLVL